MKKILIWLLTLTIALPADIYAFSYTYKGQELDFNFYKTSKTCCTLPGDGFDDDESMPSGGHDLYGALEIPSSVLFEGTNYSVTEIGMGSFYYNSISSVIIPNSVTEIGRHAFSLTQLESVEIPNSVTKIGPGAFSQCNHLRSVTISNAVTQIDDGTFYECRQLSSVEIPNSVVKIGSSAFYNCALKSITIPNSVTTIGYSAFNRCNLLTEIYCDAEIPPVCMDYAFLNVNVNTCKLIVPGSSVDAYRMADGWKDFTNIVSAEGVELIFTVDGVTYSKLPNETSSVSVISADAALTALEIPATVQYNSKDYQVVEIAEKAFEQNSALYQLTIPASVVDIKSAAFEGCTSLTLLYLLEGFEDLHIDCISVNTGNSDRAEGKHAFRNCPLHEVYIGRNLKYISDNSYGWSPFAYTPLLNATFGESVTTLPLFLFHECAQLTSFNIPSHLTQIAYNNFGEYGFRTCSTLSNIKVDPANPSYTSVDGMLYDKNQSKLLLMPASNSTASFEIPESVTEIGQYALHNCKNLTSVTIPPSISKIGVGAFYGCTGLQTVVYEAARPIAIDEENTESYYEEVFSHETYSKAELWINSSAYQLVKSTNPWSQFANISYTTLELSASELSMVEDDSEQIIATTSKGENLTNGLAWTSSNPSVATVSETGMITAVGIGVSTITCTWTEPNGNVQSKDIVVEVKDCVVRIIVPNGYTELCGAATNSFKIRFGCEPGYVLHQVMLDDMDITDEVNASPDGSYVLQPARKDRELFVVFRQDISTNIEEVQSTAQNIKLYVADGHISIEGAEFNSEVQLYDTTGRLLKRTNSHSFEIDAHGVLILIVEGQNFKFSM